MNIYQIRVQLVHVAMLLSLLGNATRSWAGGPIFREPQHLRVPGYPADAAAFDWDRDGFKDILVSREYVDSITVFLNDHEGRFTQFSSFSTPSRPRPLGVADLNGDGFHDLLVGTAINGVVTTYLSDANGLGPGVSNESPVDVRKFLIGDFDEEGDLDVIVVEWQGVGYWYLRNDGSGGFTWSQAVLGYGDIYDAASGDVNGDGHLDFVLAPPGRVSLFLFLGNGHGGLSSIREIDYDDGPIGVALADLDRDGDLELIVCNGLDWNVAIFYNRGDGTFEPPIRYSGGYGPHSPVVEDFDQNGYPDMVVGSQVYASIGTFMNDGAGSLLPREDFTVGYNPGGFAVADFDRNGFPDLVVCRAPFDSIAVLLNANGEITSVLVTNVTHEIVAGAVVVTWYLASGLPTDANVYRKEVAGWVFQGSVNRNAQDTFVWKDAEVSPGTTYEYRLGVRDGDREVFVGDVAVSVPIGWTLGIAGVSPNPTSRDAWVTFILPTSEPATLSLHDVAGRRIHSQQVGSLGSGRHVLNSAQGVTLAPGLYVVRLEQGGKAAMRRFCVIR